MHLPKARSSTCGRRGKEHIKLTQSVHRLDGKEPEYRRSFDCEIDVVVVKFEDNGLRRMHGLDANFLVHHDLVLRNLRGVICIIFSTLQGCEWF